MADPFLRPRTPFEKATRAALDRAKPNRGVGILDKPLPGGHSLEAKTQRNRGQIDIHPFFILSSGLIHAGTVNGVIPEYDGDPIGESGNALTLTGDFYVYLRAIYELTFGAHEFLSAANLTGTPEIITNSTPLTDNLDVTDDIVVYRLIAQVITGRVQRAQTTRTNLSIFICDQSDGTSEGRAVGVTWGTS